MEEIARRNIGNNNEHKREGSLIDEHELNKESSVSSVGSKESSYIENLLLMCSFGRMRSKMACFCSVGYDIAKAGSVKCGVRIQEPSALLTMNREEFYVVICAARHADIGKQLEDMGITDYQYHRLVPLECAVPMELVYEDKTEGASPFLRPVQSAALYPVGYVPGVFDLFHVGHLNLLRNAKSRCEYLIAGVLTDELVEHFKKRKPVIPYAQRAAIISAVSYVDRVVPVDFSNTRKIDLVMEESILPYMNVSLLGECTIWRRLDEGSAAR